METEEKYMLMPSEVMRLNALFPDDEPIFVIDDEHHTFDWAKNRNDSMMRLQAKLEEVRGNHNEAK
ncbi:hypothetical protein [Leuconostoc lactis]|uniref:hypothetical protein n=1 Tax=Leuconostoc lactis TaxID=1246 RepID=UPI0022E2A89B|nr:hypothetical protein [Leuconostoc lactis]